MMQQWVEEHLETRLTVGHGIFLPFRVCADRELREKEKIQSDLEKAERSKTQLAAEVDEHHSAIEHMNKVNLR